MEDAKEEIADIEKAYDKEHSHLPVAVTSAPKLATMLKPISVAEAVEGWKQYQELKRAILDPDDYQDYDGKPAPKKSAWRKIGRAFGVCDEIVRENIVRDNNDHILRCEMVVRVTAPNGQYAEGFGACSVAEARFKGEKSRMRADNDIPATAHTRAKSRAISDLVGGGEVSAEELVDDDKSKVGEITVPTLATPAQVVLVLRMSHSKVFSVEEQDGAWKFCDGNPTKEKTEKFVARLKALIEQRKAQEAPQQEQGQPATEQAAPGTTSEPGGETKAVEQPELALTEKASPDAQLLEVAHNWEAHLSEGHAPEMIFEALLGAEWSDADANSYRGQWSKAKHGQSKRNILREMADKITTV